MAEVNIPVTPGSGENVDGYSLPDGKLVQGVAIVDTVAQGRPATVAATGVLSAGLPNAALAASTFTALDAVVAAPDGAGTLISGTPTTGSVFGVAIPAGMTSWLILVKGLTAAQTAQTVYFEASNNSTTGLDGDWVEVKGRRTGTAANTTDTVDYKTTNNGYYRGNVAGFTWLRARLLGTGFTAGCSVTITSSAGIGPTFLNSAIPGGVSTIGGAYLVDVAGTNKAKVNTSGDQAISLTSPGAAAIGLYANLNPNNSLRVTNDPASIFMEAADGAVINTAQWTASGTQVPTQGSGQITLAPTVGASVANNSLLVSTPTFTAPGVSFLIFSSVVTLEAAQTASVNTHRFWGKGQTTSFAYATPVTDGIGFEIDGSTGALQCVVYIAGTKYVVNSSTVANITSSFNGAVAGGTPAGTALPSGVTGSAFGAPLTWHGGACRYAVMIRSDVVYWFVSGTEIPVAALSYGTPNVQGLPIRIHDITNGAATSLAHTFQINAIAVNDLSSGNMQMSDGTYPWRKATVAATYPTGSEQALDVRAASPLPGLSLYATSTSYSTSMAVNLGNLVAAAFASGVANNLPELTAVEFYVINNTNQIANGSAALSFTDTINSVAMTVNPSDYAPFTSSTAIGASTQSIVRLYKGYLRNPVVTVTFASAPTSGTLGVLAVFHTAGQGGNVITDSTNSNPLRVFAENAATQSSNPTGLVVMGHMMPTNGVYSTAFTHGLQVTDTGAVGVGPAALTKGVASMNVFSTRQAITAAFVNSGVPTTFQAAPAANLSIYVTDLTIANIGTATLVQLTNGLVSATTPIFDIWAAINTPITVRFAVPLKLSAATALGLFSSVASTTLYVGINGYIAP